MRDYNSKLGIDIPDSLKRNQYFVDLQKIKELTNIDSFNLRTMFDFYESLKLSSISPEGFEEDVPINIDGVSYIFKQGKLEPLIDDGLLAKIKKSIFSDETTSEPATRIVSSNQDVFDELNEPNIVTPVFSSNNENKNITKPTPLVVPQSAFAEPTKPQMTSEQQKQITELTNLANGYAEGSLERRVIEDEIKKIEQK